MPELLIDKYIEPKTGLTDAPKPQTISRDERIQQILARDVAGGSPIERIDLELSKYQPYLGHVNIMADLEEARAQQQSIGQQLAFGTGRLVGTTATKLMEGLGYTAMAIPALLMSDADVMLDNAFSETVSNIEEWMREDAMPIYHTNKYKQGNVFQQMGTLGFWMDDVIDGAAFMLSNIIGAKGVSALGKGVGGYSKLAKTFSKMSKAVKTGKVAGKSAANLDKLVKTMDLATMSLYNSVTEAAFEAKDIKDSLMKQGLTNGEASEAAMNTFWSNVAVLMGPNMVTNSMIFKPFKASKGAVKSVYKNGKLVSESLKDLTKGDIAGIFAKRALTSMASEGLWEENIQLAIQNYETGLALGEEDRNRLTGLAEEWVNNFTTDEGQKSMMLGAIIGLIPGGIGGVREAKGERDQAQFKQQMMGATLAAYHERMDEFIVKDENDEVIIDPKTRRPMLDIASVSDAFYKQMESMKNMANSVVALESGNETMYKFLSEQKLASLATAYLTDPDGLEHFKNELDGLAKKEIETLQRVGNYEVEEDVHELKAKYSQRADQFQSMYDAIVNNYTAGLDFGTSNDAQKAKREIVGMMFMEAANQNFWVERRGEIESKISRLEADNLADSELNQSEVRRLTKELEGIENIIQTSESKFRELSSSKWQKDFFKNRENTNERVEDYEGITNFPVTDTEGKNLIYEGKAPGDLLHTLINEEGKIEKLSDEEIKDRGIKDAAGNYIVEPDILVDPEGFEYVLDGKEGDYFRIKDLETGELGLIKASEIAEWKFKNRDVGTVEEEVIKKDKERLAKYAENRKEFADLLKTEEGTEARAELDRALEDELGNREYEDLKFTEIFDKAGITGSIPVIYRGEVGDLYRIDDFTVVFEAIGSDTKVEFSYQSTMTLGDHSISIYKNFVFDIAFPIGRNGKTIIINGVELENKFRTPLKAINEDENGNPTSVWLWKGKHAVLIKNPTIVKDLALAISLVEETRHKVLDYIKESREGFVMVKDPKSKYGKEYAVYNKNGKWIVSDRLNGKPYKETITSRILDVFFKATEDRVIRFNEFLAEQNIENNKVTREDIQNELRELDNIIRQATPGEINESKSAAEVQSGEEQFEEPLPFPDERTSIDTENLIIDDKAGQMAEERTNDQMQQDRKEGTLEDHIGMEALNDSEIPDKDKESVKTSKKRGIDPSNALAYNYTKMPLFDKWISDKANKLGGYVLHLSIGFDENPGLTEWWKKHANLRSKIENKTLSKAEIDELLKLDSKKGYANNLDIIPIKAELKDKTGKTVPDGVLFIHEPSFKTKDTEETPQTQKDASRENRRRMLEMVLKGDKPIITGLDKNKGKPNNLPKGVPYADRNNLVTSVFPIKDADLKVGIADNNGYIRHGENETFNGEGNAGNVFLETNETANGETTVVKLNTAKLSNEHAKIVFSALMQAYGTGGNYNTLYKGEGVEGLTNREVLRYLVLEGKKFTAQSERAKPKKFLIAKQLWVEDRIIHFGDGFTIAIDSATTEDVTRFVKWATINKNYAVDYHMTGKPLVKDFRIGKLVAKQGESYDAFLLKNGLVQTDLSPELPFRSPTIMFDINTLTLPGQAPAPVAVKTEPVDGGKKERITRRLANGQHFADLPVGTKLFIEETMYGVTGKETGVTPKNFFQVVEQGGARKVVLLITKGFYTKKFAKYQYGDVTDVALMNELVNEFDYEPLKATFERTAIEKVVPKKKINLSEKYNLYRIKPTDRPDYKKADLNKELAWLKKILPKEKVHLIDDLIKVGDQLAYGQLTRDAILLSKMSEEGTAYHEAFHRVSMSYLTDKERANMYAQAREKYNLQDRTDKAVEERLANEFMKYVMAKEKAPVEKKLPSKVRSFFKRLWDFIYYLFVRPSRLTKGEVENVFEAINRGKFAKGKLRYDNNYYKDSTEFLSNALGLSSKEISATVKALAAISFSINKISTLGDIKKLDFGETYWALKEDLKDLEDAGQILEAGKLKVVLENYGDFTNLVESYLLSLKINKVQFDDNPLEDENSKGLGQSEWEKTGKTSYETNFKDNMLSSIKMLIMTLPEGEYDEYSYIPTAPAFADFNSTWNRIMNDMHNADTIEEMMEILEKRGQDDVPYQRLLARLKAGDETLRTQFEVSVKRTKHKFLDLTFEMRNGKPVFQFQDTDISRASKKFVREWSEALYTSDFFTKQGKLKSEKVEAMMDFYKDLGHRVHKQFKDTGTVADIDTEVANTVKLLNAINIPVDSKVINYILAKKEDIPTDSAKLVDFLINDINQLFGPNGVLARRLVGPIKTERGVQIPDDALLTDERAAELIAESYMIAKPEEMSVTVLGPAGNPYYVYAPNNYITDSMRRFKKDPKTIQELLDTVNSANSFILKQLKGDPKKLKEFAVRTFSGFIQTKTGDTGRDYLGLNSAEDLLLKLTAIHSGYKYGKPTKGILPMPTMADRKTYYMYEGIDLLDYKMQVTGNRLTAPVDSEVVDLFIKYAEDETNRIALVKKQIDQAVASRDGSALVEGLHYIIEESGGRAKKYLPMDNRLVRVMVNADGKYMGNGARYQHFKMFNDKEFKGQRSDITEAIDRVVDDTIEYASELGIVTIVKDKNGKPVIKDNVLLDETLVDKIATSEFGGNKQFAMHKIIANYAVNSMMANIETAKMFSGDMAFYKGETSKETAEDKIKRSTVLTSTGDNLRTVFPEGHELHGKTYYSVATLESSYLKSKYYQTLFDKHVGAYIAEGKTKGDAEKRATFKLKKYTHVDQTDAQVYISPSMYKSLLIRLGEWTSDKQEAFDLLESDRVLTREEEVHALDLIMPPLKFVHYGLYARNGLAVPIYDKMSMAPLFRRLVENTDLEDLHNRMEVKGKYSGSGLQPIEMVKFDSAVKVGGTERVHYYTDRKDRETGPRDLFDKPLPVQSQKFEFLRRQLLTDPHDVLTSLFGTQVKKLGMSNIIGNAEYHLEGELKPILGDELTKEWTTLLSNLSNKGKTRLLSKLGITQEGKTYKVKDYTKLMNMLREDARKAGMPDNILDALKVEKDNTLYMTIDSIPERRWIYSRFISIINKHTVDLNLPGNAFIQMSNFGLHKISDKKLDREREEIEWIDDTTKETRSRPLKFYDLDAKGGVKPMECFVSINLFKNVIPGYNNMSWEEKKQWVKNNPEIMGYRIPTQGLNSISHLKVVGLLREQLGDTIVLPAEFTALTGSDFDIDKLYVSRYNYNKDGISKVEYLTNANSNINQRIEAYADEAVKEYIDDTNKAYKALIHQFHHKIGLTKNEIKYIAEVMDDLKLKDLREYATIDYVNTEYYGSEIEKKLDAIRGAKLRREFLKEDVEALKERRREEIEEYRQTWIDQAKAGNNNFITRPIDQQNTKEAMENRLLDVYKAVITSEHHYTQVTTPLDAATSLVKDVHKKVIELRGDERKATASLWELSPRYQAAVKEKYTGGKGGIGPFALGNAHHVLGQIAKLTFKLNIGVGNTTEVEGKLVTNLAGTKDMNGEYILDWMSALINAHVDIAKDPYIFDLNVNAKTYGMTNMLVRSGVGKLAFYFLPQPILVDLAKEDALQKGKIIANEGVAGKIIRQRWKELHEKALLSEGKGHLTDSSKATQESIWDEDRLQKDINYKTKNDSNYYARQLQILDEYQRLNVEAVALNEVVMSSRIDTKQYGKNFSEIMGFMNRYEKMWKDDKFYNLRELFDNTFLSTLFDNSVAMAQDLFGTLTMTGTTEFQSVVKRIMQLTDNRYTIDNKFINFIADELFSSIAAQFFIKEKGADTEKVRKLFYDKEGLVNKIARIKSGKLYPELRDNRLISLFSTDIEKGQPAKLKLNSNTVKEKWDRDELVRAFNDILNHKDKTISTLGVNIVMYSFFTSGFNKGIYSFHQFIPNDFLKDFGYADFMQRTLDSLKGTEGKGILNDAIDELFINNWSRTKSQKNLKTNDLVPVMGFMDYDHSIVRGGRTYVFQVPYTRDSKYYLGTDDAGQPMYAPYVKSVGVEDLLYKYIGYNKGTKNAIYRLVPVKKGYFDRGFVIKDYYLKESVMESNTTKIDEKSQNEAVVIMEGRLEKPTPTLAKLSKRYEDSVFLETSDLNVTKPGVDAIKKSSSETTEDVPIQRELEFAEPIKVKTTWARRSENNYEVSTRGDSRFSAFNAKIKAEGNKSIEELYQTEVKGYNSIKEGKGKPPKTGLSREETYNQYKELWVAWANENSKLMQELANNTSGKVLTDMFATTDINQARALSEILNEFDYLVEPIEGIEIKARGKMTFSYGTDKRDDVKATTTLGAIKSGERTATTRYESQGNIEYWKRLSIGDRVEFEGKTGEKVIVEITDPLRKLKDKHLNGNDWSKLEGWSLDYYLEKVFPKIDEAWQMEYKLVVKGIEQVFTLDEATAEKLKELKDKYKHCF